MQRTVRAMCSVLSLTALSACTGTAINETPSGITTATTQPAWPAPPLTPRIRLLGSVAKTRDWGISPSLWKRVKNFVRGEEQTLFVRPSGVAARDDMLYVADIGAPALWILDPHRRGVRRVSMAGSEPLVSPVAVALGPDNRIFLADSYHRKVFVFDMAGRFHSALAHGEFRRPAGLAYDIEAARLYVADSAAHRVWVLSEAGHLVQSIGERGAAPGEFNFPTHVAIGSDNTLYVTDALGFRVQRFDGNGRFLGAFGKHGDGSGDFAAPKGVASDSEGHVYVVDALFDTVQIFDRGGRLLLNFGEHGTEPGQFWLPGGIFIDDADRIYVTDSYNQRIQVFQYLKGGRFE